MGILDTIFGNTTSSLEDKIAIYLALFTALARADGKVDEVELSFSRSFLADIPGVKGLTENQWESIFSKADKNMVEFGTQSGWTSWAKKLTEEDKDELITYLVQGAASDGHIDSSEVAFILVISQTIGHDGMDVLAYMEQNYGLDKAEVDLAFSRLETMMKAAGLG